MSQIISTYPVFEGSQVLTSTQLNQLSAYLDQQGRLTRSKLIGIGIVCGLQIEPLPNGLRITKGLGITSEGFLIQSGRFDASHYTSYTLPEGVSYSPFEKEDEEQVELFELLTEKPEDTPGVKKLSSPANFLNNKYVILFLEIFDKDLKSCLGNSCDDRGQDRLLTIRRLLVNESDLNHILTKSSNVREPFPSVDEFPVFPLRKPLFDPSGDETKSFKPFVENYQKAIKTYFSEELIETLTKSYSVFDPILGKTFAFQNPFEKDEIIGQIKEIQSLSEGDPEEIIGIQYLWDFIKEVHKAYAEFLSSAKQLWYTCPTDSSLFPLHLMLGKAKSNGETLEKSLKYRHGFIQPPIFNGQRGLVEQTIQRHRRLVLIIEKFELSLISKPNPEKFPIKITPSVEKMENLGLRSIPYYYEIKSKSKVSAWFSLEKTWKDPHSPRHESSLQTEDVLSYDNQSDEWSKEAVSPLESPLFYDLDAFNFYRVEGHLGKSLDEALDQTSSQIKFFNLPFKLQTLYLGEADGLLAKGCGWNDLQEEYAHQRIHLIGLIRDLQQVFDFVEKLRDDDSNERTGNLREVDLEKEAKEALFLLQALSKSLPDCLGNLNWEEFQEAYKSLLQAVLDFILIRMKLLEEIKLKPQTEQADLNLYNGLLTRISSPLYRLIDLLFFGKIQRLYLSYRNRMTQMSKSHQLDNYLKKHPGLNHLAGVKPGGTFFFLYDPKLEQIVGDFSLPYQCCEDTCIDPCADDQMNLPPFARPDYAITLTNTPVEIEVMINDQLLSGREYGVKLVSDASNLGGKVTPAEKENRFSYLPPSGFAGLDYFEYELIDKEANQSDIGRVSILVQGQAGCYSIEVLTCWGMKNVRETLEKREIPTANLSDQEAISALEKSLRESNGFTLQEIRGGVLEDQKSKQSLLSCLGISATPNDDLEKLILEHQTENCGSNEQECTAMSISGIVVSPTGQGQPGVNVLIKGTTTGVTTDFDGNFFIQFPNAGPTLEFSTVGFINQELLICNQEFVTVTLSQAEVPTRECYSISIIQSWPTALKFSILESRQIPNSNFNEESINAALLTILRESRGFSRLELEQGAASGEENLRAILRSLSIDFSDANPSTFPRIILGYQTNNCGSNSNGEVIVVTAERVSALDDKELRDILAIREVRLETTASKEELVEAIMLNSDSTEIKREEAAVLKKNSLVSILNETPIVFTRSETKAVLMDKLFKK